MKSTKLLLSLLVLLSVLYSCRKDIPDTTNEFSKVSEYDHTIISEWNELILELDRYSDGYRPGPIANVLGYIGFANYEACISGMPDYQSLARLYANVNIPQAETSKAYHWPSVINSVNNYFYTRLFKDTPDPQYRKIKILYDKFDKTYATEIENDTYLRSKNHGEIVASAVWEWMKTDQSTFNKHLNVFEDYDWQAKFRKNGDWVATYPGPGKGMFPYWGKGRTFAITENQKICKPISYYAPYSEAVNSAFYAQALETMSQNTPTLSYQSQWVAEFWSDDLVNLTFSPPARWIAIANQIYTLDKVDLEKAILANARTGMALHDAAIGCWNSKYHYNLERPQTYINRIIDPTWKPNLHNPLTGEEGITPSFPAYPSGHATFGASASEALASVFGYNYGMTDNCHQNRSEFLGYPRTFSSLGEMALENAWSRIPLGVHYRMDAEEGMRYGKEIGNTVNKLSWRR